MITEYKKWHIFILTYWLRPFCIPGILYLFLIGRLNMRGYVIPKVKGVGDLISQLPFRLVSVAVFAPLTLLIGSIET